MVPNLVLAAHMIGGTTAWSSRLNLFVFVIFVGIDYLAVRLQRKDDDAATADADKDTLSIINVTSLMAVAGGVVAPKLFPSLDLTSLALPFKVAGIALIVAGTSLRLRAISTLGRYFRQVIFVEEAHQVITTGPYRLLRHPGYLGSMLSLIGLTLCFNNILGLVLLPLPFAAYVYRIMVEEAAMAASLGDAYRAWSSKTKRLIPGVW